MLWIDSNYDRQKKLLDERYNKLELIYHELQILIAYIPSIEWQPKNLAFPNQEPMLGSGFCLQFFGFYCSSSNGRICIQQKKPSEHTAQQKLKFLRRLGPLRSQVRENFDFPPQSLEEVYMMILDKAGKYYCGLDLDWIMI